MPRPVVTPVIVLGTLDDDPIVQIVVSSVRSQPLDQAMLRHVGVEPISQRILVLKSSVHFRADFDPIASRTLLVEWPGCNPIDPTRCRYERLRAGMRLAPGQAQHGTAR